jgi:ATP synthase protein I
MTKDFNQEIEAKVARKLRAQRLRSKQGVWSSLGMIGIIGWSVVIPTLLGAGCGLWIDRQFPGTHSWTLMLLIVGLCVGCLNAWHWVAREDQEMREEQDSE